MLGASSRVFRHADGSLYAQPPSPERVDAHAKVFFALRNLGFRELEVEAVLAELCADPALADATVQQLLREALCHPAQGEVNESARRPRHPHPGILVQRLARCSPEDLDATSVSARTFARRLTPLHRGRRAELQVPP